MTRRRRPKEARERASAAEILQAVPYRNEAMELKARRDGGVLATVPMRRPKFLVPPLSWILPYSTHRQVELDAAGAAVLQKCDGKHTVEGIIEEFAAENKLSFREAQLPVTQFLQQLTQRGLIATVGLNQHRDER